MEVINKRKLSDEKDEKRDLLSNLINANEELSDDGEQRLGEAELIGAWPTLGIPGRLFTPLPFRKHFHVLPCWTRGEDTLTDMNRRLISVDNRRLDIPFVLL